MQLRKEHVEKFKNIHRNQNSFKNYSEEQLEEIANGMANYYLTLYAILKRTRLVLNNS